MAARGRGVRLWLLLLFAAFSFGIAQASESPAAPAAQAEAKSADPGATAPARKSAIVRERDTLFGFFSPAKTDRTAAAN